MIFPDSLTHTEYFETGLVHVLKMLIKPKFGGTLSGSPWNWYRRQNLRIIILGSSQYYLNILGLKPFVLKR